MRITFIFCLALILAGCASLSDIRQSEPTYVLRSETPPGKLANCIAYESQSEMDSWNRFWDPAKITEHDGTYKILVTLSNSLSIPFSKPMAELTIAPGDAGGATIEYRTFSVWGGKEKFWDLVKHCASPQNSPGK